MSEILGLVGKLKFIRDYECTTKDEVEAINEAIVELIQASERPEIIRCKDCMHRGSGVCPMYYEEWAEVDEGDGYFDIDNIVHDYTTDEGFCYMSERG